MQRLLLLLLCCLLLTGCTRDPIEPMASDIAANIPAPVVADTPVTEKQAVLWFRYGTEPMLAPELRTLPLTASENAALAILRALVHGPGAASYGLEPLFPPGTQVISATQSGRVMFVTLSRQIMNSYADEPAAWRNQPIWAAEVPLRRILAMQSIVATVTENFPVDEVVILVNQPASDSLRLRQAYYTLDGDMSLADPLIRNESLLLTAPRTAEVILECIMARNWQRLYLYIARQDAFTGAARPEETAFIQALEPLPHLLSAEIQGASVINGHAVVTVSGAYLQDGAAIPFAGHTLHLTQHKGLWQLGISQLTGRGTAP